MNNKWAIKARGYYTKGTTMYNDILPFITEVTENNFKNVKILTKANSKKEGCCILICNFFN